MTSSFRTSTTHFIIHPSLCESKPPSLASTLIVSPFCWRTARIVLIWWSKCVWSRYSGTRRDDRCWLLSVGSASYRSGRGDAHGPFRKTRFCMSEEDLGVRALRCHADLLLLPLGNGPRGMRMLLVADLGLRECNSGLLVSILIYKSRSPPHTHF